MSHLKDTIANTLFDFMPNFYNHIHPIFNTEHSSDYKLNSNQIKVLMGAYLLEDPTPTSISKVLYIHKGSMTAIVRSLINERLLKKVHDPNDERSYKLALTEEGLDFLQYKEEKRQVEINHLFEEMPYEDLEQVISGFQVLNHYLNKVNPSTGGRS